jgi:type I restriction enzyme S subunit
MKKKYLSNSIYKITPQAVVKSSAKFLSKQSVLFVVRGMILSHSFPVAINTEKATVNQDMKALTIYIDGLEEYVYLALKGSSQEILKKVRTSTHGTCRLESDIYYNWVVAMPPLDEQQDIITKVEKLLALCDQLETQITQDQIHAEQLMQAVLREAFSQPPDQQNQEAANA